MIYSDDIKNRLNDYVVNAIGGTVSNNWNVNISVFPTDSVATIKIEPDRILNITYGNRVPEAGAFRELSFTIFVSMDIDREQEGHHPINYSLLDYVEHLTDYLIEISGNVIERNTYNIYRIYDLQTEEYISHDTSRPRSKSTFVIRGKLLSKFLD